MRTKINKENFNGGIDLWVSNAVVSSHTGNKVYWASIEQFQGGALLYLAHSVYEGLSEVNANTVLKQLATGKFEITEARDRETNELITLENGEQLYMISKAREVAHLDWE